MAHRMHFHTGLLTAASVFLSVFAVQIATAEPSDPPYQEKLERLSEIIGSVHFLRNLCGETSNIWRDKMDQLLEAENPASERKSRLVARFNRGYRSFSGNYQKCTPAATAALARYTAEGAQLSEEIVLRYGN